MMVQSKNLSYLTGLFFILSIASLSLIAEPKLELKQITLLDKNISTIEKGFKLKNKPKLILLSGPTDNWHSDLAWWILGQNYLAKNYQTLAVERASQGFSDIIEKPSYRDFAERLKVLIKDEKEPVVIVAFASSNLSVQLVLQDIEVARKVKGVVFIDPDVLTKHALNHYTGESENYRKNWQQLEDYIKAGKYQERIEKKIAGEKQHLAEIIPAKYENLMDWPLYEQYELQRKKPEYQINKFKEVTAYKKDLEAAMAVNTPTQVPLVILDTDFETAYLKTLDDEKVKASIVQWRDEGKAQFFHMASHHSCSAYWPVKSQEHLLTYTRPDLIERAVQRLENCKD
ncbi:MAG: alpha/beta hydrolase [Gammaproteobacteria bacterium]|nr:alpha/beta hydrolase [Gammaproteobacteria bacterium]